jgi:hypothetical protein
MYGIQSDRSVSLSKEGADLSMEGSNFHLIFTFCNNYETTCTFIKGADLSVERANFHLIFTFCNNYETICTSIKLTLDL